MPQTETMTGGASNFIDTVRVGETDYPIKPSIMQKVTYEQLVGLRQANKLVEGHWYRITNYQCTTTQEGTQSAGHQFDIIVRADDKYALNENAFAIEHEGDTYFENANLSAWELKYCLDNDTNRFAWADPTNGKGVIYYMKDEFNNECPYDFKNIQYVFEEGFEYDKWGKTFAVNRNSSLDTEVDGTMYYGYTVKGDGKPSGWTDSNCYTKKLVTNASEPLYSAPNGSLLTGGNIIKVSIESFTTYTFDDNGNDATLATQHRCYNNHISPYYFSNYKGAGYKNCFILNGIFAKGGSYISCHDNIFGNGCYNITLAATDDNNIFGNGCYNITLGGGCSNNIFRNGCYNNVFGNSCSHNTFGDNCDGITFGDYCSHNTFGDFCYHITFGSSAQSPQSYFENIIFENGNRNINLTCIQTTSSSSKCQNILVALGVNNANTAKTITIDAVNQTNRTVVRAAADTEITA